MTPAAEFVLARVRADLGTVPGLPADPLAAGPDPDWDDELVVSVFGGRHEFGLGLEEGVEWACWHLADQVQDDVIGELGRPWPELAGVGVLEPALVGGLAAWVLRGRAFCAVGQLGPAVGAAGRTLA